MLFTPERVCKVVALRQSNRSSTDSEAGCERDDVHKRNEKEISDKEASSGVSLPYSGKRWREKTLAN